MAHFESFWIIVPHAIVWKFQDFSVIQILRQINFVGSRSAKSAISTHLEALNCVSNEFFHILKAEIYQINHFQSP